MGLISNKNFMEKMNKKINMIVWDLKLFLYQLQTNYSFALCTV